MFLGLYLEALDEELVTLRSSIGTHRPASTLKVKELEEEAHSSESQTEMRERDYTVRRSSELGLAVLMYTWTRKGKFGRVAHLAHIRWKVLFDHTRVKPARYCHC